MAASIEQVNMTEGALLPKVLRFSLPLAATGVLQLLFCPVCQRYWFDFFCSCCSMRRT